MKRLYLLLVLLVLALAACGSATQQVTATSAIATPSSTAYSQAASAAATADAKNNSGDNNNPYTSTPAATKSAFLVGEPVTSGTWQITINSAKTSAGSEYDQALKQGDTYLTINFTLKNLSATAQSLWLFTLRDGQGNTYQETYLYGNRQSYGTIVSGQQLRGDLSYEVPTAVHTFVLQFDPIGDYDGSEIVQWTIKD